MVARGEGNYLIDVDGHRYLDGVASLWCNAFGHRVPHIDQAIREQLDQIAHSTLLGHSNTKTVELAKRLARLAPAGLNKVFFSDNGSTCVEVALKMAYQYFQQVNQGALSRRKTFLALDQAYHGDTLGAVSVGGIDLFHQVFGDLLFEVVRADVPRGFRIPGGLSPQAHQAMCLEKVDRLFEEQGRRLAAAIVEPRMQGAAGMLLYPHVFLRHLVERCREHGVLVIFDEVAVGMGRSGRLFACQKEDLVPDFLCLAKGLTGGYLPLSATLTTDEIYSGFLGPPEQGRTFFHGHTYTGCALASAAALASLDLFEADGFFEELEAKIACLTQALGRLLSLKWVGDVRQYGLMAGIELVADRRGAEAFAPSRRVGHQVCLKAREKGVFLRPLGDVVVLMPPLSITTDEIEVLVDAVVWGVQEHLAAE